MSDEIISGKELMRRFYNPPISASTNDPLIFETPSLRLLSQSQELSDGSMKITWTYEISKPRLKVNG